MKKSILFLTACGISLMASAQYTFDALQLSQTELRGTSRYMSMAGAFGALGGDISVINQNPAGIGVYRSSDLGITLSLDLNSSTTDNLKTSQTKFNVNNVGYVGALKLDSETMPNINWGFTYSRTNSFNRHARGAAYSIPTSITNYLADQANADGVTVEKDLDPEGVNPFYDRNAAWNQILAYSTYLINPTDASGTKFNGLGFEGVYGDAEYEVEERGHTDEFSISLGGNIANMLYWGMALGINDMYYTYNRYYGEALENTVIYNKKDDPDAVYVDGNANLGIVDWNRTTGTGYNFKIGAILKPVNALRLGLAFHTPTYYDMKDTYYTVMRSEFYGDNVAEKNNEYSVEDESPVNSTYYQIRTPWRFIGSVAGVIGTKGIISADYEYVGNTGIRILDDRGNEILGATPEIKQFLSPSHIIRLGGELRLTPNWSLRAGYSYQTSNAAKDVRDYEGAYNGTKDLTPVVVGGSSPAYSYDRSVQHITAGIGYHYKNFYLDMAYVHKYRQNTYNAFPLDNDALNVKWKINDHNNRISATLGFRF